MHLRSAAIAAALLSASLLAQTTAVVPSKSMVSNEGNWYSVYLFYGSTTAASNNAHTQGLYATSDITVNAGLMNGIAFKRTNYGLGAMTATTVNATLDLSVSGIAHTAPSTTFASNHGANRLQVFNGPLNLPAVPQSTWPGTWEPPVPFTVPFPYAQSMGSTLVVDWVTSGGTSGRVWYADATVIGYGSNTSALYQSNCKNSAGGTSGSWSYFTYQPYPGGQFTLSLFGYPGNVPSLNASVLVFGTQGPGGTFGGLTLPFLISSLGIPAQPNCQWGIDWLLDLPMTYTTSTSATGGSVRINTITMPNLPSLAGTSMFTQALSIDTDATTQLPVLYPSLAIKWNFGTGNKPPCSQVTRIADSAGAGVSPTGSTQLDQAPNFQLRFQ